MFRRRTLAERRRKDHGRFVLLAWQLRDATALCRQRRWNGWEGEFLF